MTQGFVICFLYGLCNFSTEWRGPFCTIRTKLKRQYQYDEESARSSLTRVKFDGKPLFLPVFQLFLLAQS
ncbi:Uncharacterised protein [Buttiauxella agrestis]|uniref:Uncharacterized protein n=1 Tax=Buttiauxella agrestis TaxID=82977 RepID=A0A381C6Y7_9ENTR|nr:Uncharacterised protein [Buttiauxella agrestis]